MSFAPAVLAIAVLALLAFALVAALRLETPWLQPVAVVRAAVQLGVLSLILSGVLRSPAWTAVFLGVMVVAATVVVVRRVGVPWRRAPAILGVLAGAATVPVAIVFASGALSIEPRYLLALGGIVVGGAMTVASLAGRTLFAALATDRAEVEGWLALGAPPRAAARRLVRQAASTALIPATDQTRTAGIVALPGAFVGAVFAGLSPLDAAVFQVLVLVSILVAGALSAAGIGWLFGAPRVLPVSPR